MSVVTKEAYNHFFRFCSIYTQVIVPRPVSYNIGRLWKHRHTSVITNIKYSPIVRILEYGAWCLQIILNLNQQVHGARQCSLRDAYIWVAFI